MAGKMDDKKQLKCSFCGKPQEQVRKLIAGPDVYICDECIDLCSDIVYEEYDVLSNHKKINIPKPAEIKSILEE